MCPVNMTALTLQSHEYRLLISVGAAPPDVRLAVTPVTVSVSIHFRTGS
jgi:hypothetical protein